MQHSHEKYSLWVASVFFVHLLLNSVCIHQKTLSMISFVVAPRNVWNVHRNLNPATLFALSPPVYARSKLLFPESENTSTSASCNSDNSMSSVSKTFFSFARPHELTPSARGCPPCARGCTVFENGTAFLPGVLSLLWAVSRKIMNTLYECNLIPTILRSIDLQFCHYTLPSSSFATAFWEHREGAAGQGFEGRSFGDH